MSVVSISETDEDLAGRWSLVFEDFALLNAKPAATRLGFAAQLPCTVRRDALVAMPASFRIPWLRILPSRSEHRLQSLRAMTGSADRGDGIVPRFSTIWDFAGRADKRCGRRPRGLVPSFARWACHPRG